MLELRTSDGAELEIRRMAIGQQTDDVGMFVMRFIERQLVNLEGIVSEPE